MEISFKSVYRIVHVDHGMKEVISKNSNANQKRIESNPNFQTELSLLMKLTFHMIQRLNSNSLYTIFLDIHDQENFVFKMCHHPHWLSAHGKSHNWRILFNIINYRVRKNLWRINAKWSLKRFYFFKTIHQYTNLNHE